VAGPGSGAGSLACWRLRAAGLRYRVEPVKGQRGGQVRYISCDDVRKVGVAVCWLARAADVLSNTNIVKQQLCQAE
jgi:hypothetical protein